MLKTQWGYFMSIFINAIIIHCFTQIIQIMIPVFVLRLYFVICLQVITYFFLCLHIVPEKRNKCLMHRRLMDISLKKEWKKLFFCFVLHCLSVDHDYRRPTWPWSHFLFHRVPGLYRFQYVCAPAKLLKLSQFSLFSQSLVLPWGWTNELLNNLYLDDSHF